MEHVTKYLNYKKLNLKLKLDKNMKLKLKNWKVKLKN